MKQSSITLNKKFNKYLIYKNEALPKEFKLHKCYQYLNNPTKLIVFDIPKSNNLFTKNIKTRLTVLDVFKREVVTLVNEKLMAGRYEVSWNTSNYVKGLYYYKLAAGNYEETHKIILEK
ncbi:MAG: hypothetical protein ACRDFC_05995 [Ignavibacteria bacterium]